MTTIEIRITITVAPADSPKKAPEQPTAPERPTAPSEEAPREEAPREEAPRKKPRGKLLLHLPHDLFKRLAERQRQEEEKAKAAAAAAATRAKQRAAGRLAAHIIPSLPEVHHATRPAFIFPYRSSHPPRGEG